MPLRPRGAKGVLLLVLATLAVLLPAGVVWGATSCLRSSVHTCPAAPGGVSASAGDHRVTLRWHGVSGATHYYVWRDGSRVRLVGSTTRSATFTALVNGHDYRFAVTALDSHSRESRLSTVVHAVPLPPIPRAPLYPRATAGPGHIDLKWTAPASGLRYDVLRNGVVVVKAQTSTTWTSTSVRNGTSYVLSVRSADAFGQRSVATTSQTVTPLDTPAGPTGVSFRAQDGQVTVGWSTALPATIRSVRLYVDGIAKATVSLAAGVRTLTGLTNGTPYAVQARTVDLNGTVSVKSVLATITPTTAAQMSPPGFTTTGGDGRVQLSWGAVVGAQSYLVLRDGVVHRSVTAPMTHDTDLAVVNGQTYHYRLQVVVVGQVSGSTLEHRATPLATPAQPTGLAASADDASVQLSWDAAPSTASAVEVVRNGTVVTSLAPDQIGWRDTQLTNGTTYSYGIEFRNLNGAVSPTSTTVRATPSPAPPAPAAPTATAGDGEVVLSWSGTSAEGWVLYRDGEVIAHPAAAPFADTGLTNDTTVVYRLAQLVGGRESTSSTPVSATPKAIPPAVPQGLVANAGDTQVTLTWASGDPAPAGWVLFRDGVELDRSNQPLYTDGALDNGSTYRYTVAAVDGRGVQSAPSAEAVATPVATRPDAPVLHATSRHEQADLTWAPGPGAGIAASWRMVRDGHVVGSVTGTSWSDYGLTDGRVYRYQVAEVYADGSSSALSPVAAARPTAPWSALAVGDDFACGAYADLGVRCWGDNSASQLGDLSQVDLSTGPTPVAGVGAVTAPEGVVAGHHHACALVAGTAWCWGAAAAGQTGHTGVGPAPVDGAPALVGLAAGGDVTCLLGADGSVWCLGTDDTGQLGDGGTAGSSRAPLRVALPATALGIAVGADHACALLADHRVSCWGADGAGQLGDGSPTRVRRPVVTSGSGDVTAVAAGAGHTCVLAGGQPLCTGTGAAGQLGLGDTVDRSRLTADPDVVGVTGIRAAGHVTCLTLAIGQARCYGAGADGRLGNGDGRDQSSPVPVQNLDTAVAVVPGGGGTTCALTRDRSTWCFGADDSGQLGVGTTSAQTAPAPAVSTLSGLVGLTRGRHAACAVTVAAPPRVRCWGSGPVVTPVLHAGEATAVEPRDLAMPGGASVRKVVVGGDTACAMTSTYQVFCWGADDWGQAGGTATTLDAPSLVTSGGAALTGSDIAVGAHISCVRRGNGGLFCFGRSDEIGAGLAGPAQPHPAPETVIDATGAPLAPIAVLAIGDDHACAANRWDPAATTPTGLLFCFGAGDRGQLGAGATASPALVAHRVGSLTGVTSVAAGSRHSCAVTQGASRVVWCFGAGDRGQLGLGDTADHGAPTALPQIGNGSRVVAGQDTTCVKSVNAGGWCFGAGDGGQVGNGLLRDVLQPATVYGRDSQILPAVAFSTDGATSCAQLTDATTTCWGDRSLGRFGANTLGTVVGVPVQD